MNRGVLPLVVSVGLPDIPASEWTDEMTEQMVDRAGECVRESIRAWLAGELEDYE